MELHDAVIYGFPYKLRPKTERISLCTDIAHEKKNYGFTPNLDFNPVFTKFNFTEFLHTSLHQRICSTSRELVSIDNE